MKIKIIRFCFGLICLFCCTQLQARIEVINITPAESEIDCTGVIELMATGNAQPFEVFIQETEMTFENVNGLLVIEGLCTGSYTIEVRPVSLPTCAKILNVGISLADNSMNEESNFPNSQPSTEASPVSIIQEPVTDTFATFDFNLYPNPATDMVQVILVRKNSADILDLTVNTPLGNKVLARQIPAKTWSVKLDISNAPPGMYYVLIRKRDGEQAIKTLVIH